MKLFETWDDVGPFCVMEWVIESETTAVFFGRCMFFFFIFTPVLWIPLCLWFFVEVILGWRK